MALTNDSFLYELECPVCDTYLHLIVMELDEKPVNCPMCGTETDWESLTE